MYRSEFYNFCRNKVIQRMRKDHPYSVFDDVKIILAKFKQKGLPIATVLEGFDSSKPWLWHCILDKLTERMMKVVLWRRVAGIPLDEWLLKMHDVEVVFLDMQDEYWPPLPKETPDKN